MEGALLLDVVVGQGTTILKLLARKNQPLLIGGNALLILDLRLNIVDSIRGLNLEGDGLASESLNEDLHRGGVDVGRVGLGLVLMMMNAFRQKVDAKRDEMEMPWRLLCVM